MNIGDICTRVSLDDLLAALARDMSDLAQTVRSGIEHEAAVRTRPAAPPLQAIHIPAHLIA